jgi:hypothetical protein
MARTAMHLSNPREGVTFIHSVPSAANGSSHPVLQAVSF